jgi:predicted ABC-type ATPase
VAATKGNEMSYWQKLALKLGDTDHPWEQMYADTIAITDPKLKDNLTSKGDFDAFVKVKVSEALDSYQRYLDNDMEPQAAKELALDELMPRDDDDDVSEEDVDEGMEDNMNDLMQYLLKDGDKDTEEEEEEEENDDDFKPMEVNDEDEDEEEEPKRMSLQVGSVISRGGKQYKLNENHRWTRMEQGQVAPQTARPQQQPQKPRPQQQQPQRPRPQQPQQPQAKQPRPQQPKIATAPKAAPQAAQPKNPTPQPAAPAPQDGPKPLPVSKGAINPEGMDTFEQFQKDGQWSPERQRLHQRIVEKHFAGKKPAKGQSVAYVLGGGPASGKSSIINAGHVSVDPDTIHIDSDAIKGDLPEYNEMLTAKDHRAAAHVHEESSYIAKMIQEKASRGGYHTLLDGTGDSSFQSLKSKVDKMRAAGQRVVGQYVTVSTEVALQRNIERAKKTGRLPPESMLRLCHANVSRVVPEAIQAGLYDEFDLWDTESGVQKVATVRDGKTQILNQELWNKFLAKAQA